MFKFCLLTIAAGNTPGDFAFFLKNVPELEDKRRHFSMTADDFDLINPNTHTCPVFRSQEDAELAKKIYRKAGVFIRESDDKNGNPWNIKFQQMYNMTSASDLFAKVSGEGADGKMMLPLYEPKMMRQMDHRWATFVNGKTVDISLVQKADVGFVVQPEYWVPYTETVLRSTTLDSSVVSALRKEDGQKLRELCLHFAMTETDADLQKVYLDATKSDDIVQKLLNAAEKYCPKKWV